MAKQKKRFFFFTVCMLLFKSFTYAQIAPEPVIDIRDKFRCKIASLAVDDKHAYVVWDEIREHIVDGVNYEGTYEVFFKSKPLDGKWSDSSLEKVAANGFYPQIVAHKGFLYLVWTEGDKIIFKRKTPAQKWSDVPAEVIAERREGITELKIAVDDKNVYVTWDEEISDIEGITSFSIFYKEKAIDGKLPKKMEILCKDGSCEGAVNLALATETDTVCVAWKNKDLIYYKQKTLPSDFFKDAEIVAQKYGPLTNLQLFASEGKIYVIWNDFNNICREKDKTADWTAAREQLLTGDYFLIISNMIYGVWSDSSDTKRLYLETKKVDGAWSADPQFVANFDGAVISMVKNGTHLYLLFKNGTYEEQGTPYITKGIFYIAVADIK